MKYTKKLVIPAFLVIFLGCSETTLNKQKASFYFEDPNALKLIKAVESEDRQLITDLIKNGIDPNLMGKEKVTPVFWAMHGHDWDSVKYLLENGADPNLRGLAEETPTSLAAGSKYTENLAILLKYGGDVNALNRRREPNLLNAVMNRNFSNVKLLVEHNADLNLGNSHTLPLHYSITIGEYGIALYLLESGVDYLQPNPFGTYAMSRIAHTNPYKEKIIEKVIDFFTKRKVRIPFPVKLTATSSDFRVKGERAKYESYIKIYDYSFDCFVGRRECTEEDEENYSEILKYNKCSQTIKKYRPDSCNKILNGQ
jgi:hypothetical protein